ncbi:hypothetical protein [Vibrio hangzhouensis]|uniref:Uncharacterized protein n=1 Tax=Vibrio hangzhouensis TaxID=462991 RepID=A0A1H5RZJ9_9VIBR|nr:hypothetical protein [Vibrio hangzhouensis]SEF43749.1 hypothetical protein SAMN04488244_101188 [Vibrio hangzhouensis]
MPIEIKQMSIRSNVTTEKETTSKQQEHSCDDSSNNGNTLSNYTVQHTAQFQSIKWVHRKLQQEVRER